MSERVYELALGRSDEGAELEKCRITIRQYRGPNIYAISVILPETSTHVCKDSEKVGLNQDELFQMDMRKRKVKKNKCIPGNASMLDH